MKNPSIIQQIASTLLISLFAFAVNGCAVQMVQNYPGPPRPHTETAQLWINWQDLNAVLTMDLDLIDGKPVPPEAVSLNMRTGGPRVIDFLPGRHTLVVRPIGKQGIASYASSTYPVEVQWTAEAGKDYILRSQLTSQDRYRAWVDEDTVPSFHGSFQAKRWR